MGGGDPYATVTTYVDLLRVNVDFLHGRLTRTPYHSGPIDSETLAILTPLVQLHEYGILTINSQPALRNEPVYIPHVWKNNGTMCGQWWVQTEQRPYVEAYLPTYLESAFRAYMSTEDNFYYAMYTFEDASSCCFQWGRRCRVRLLHSTFPSQRFTLTRERSHADPHHLLETLWSPYSVWRRGTPPDHDFEGYPVIEELLSAHTVKIIIAGKWFGDDSATQCLLTFLKHADVTPLFPLP